MSQSGPTKLRLSILFTVSVILVAASQITRADSGSCGGQTFTLPFTDVQGNIFFCTIAEAYTLGLTNGTTPTTYSPSDPVPREQMSVFVTRTYDAAIKRGNRRAALNQWWIPSSDAVRAVDLGTADGTRNIIFDGADLWISNLLSNTVSRVRASDGRLLQTWTGANGAESVIACAGRIFITGDTNPGMIYVINPESASGGTVSVFEPNIGNLARQITFDGTSLWTANASSISRINVATGADFTFTTGLIAPTDIEFDGATLWVTDGGDDRLKRIDRINGAVLDSYVVGSNPLRLLFDGTNLWVSNNSGNSINVVRASGALRGTTLQILTGFGIDGPRGMAFDGERVLVCNGGNSSVSLFRASDLTPLVNVSVGTTVFPASACSDGVNFWIVRGNTSDIVRF